VIFSYPSSNKKSTNLLSPPPISIIFEDFVIFYSRIK
jgi:hypothetical protein